MPIKDSDQRLGQIRRRSTDALAYGRTVMANERTLLAFLRTSIGLMGGGIGIVGLVKHPYILALGWLAILLSIPLLVWAVWRYRDIKGLLTKVRAEVLMADKQAEGE